MDPPETYDLGICQIGAFGLCEGKPPHYECVDAAQFNSAEYLRNSNA